MKERLSGRQRSASIFLLISLLLISISGLWLGLTFSITALSAVSGTVAVALAAIQVWLAWLALQRTPSPWAELTDESTRAEAAVEALLSRIAGTWADEEPRRRLADPDPLPVSWCTVGPPLSDHWRNARTDGSQDPVILDGTLTASGESAIGPLDLIWKPGTRGRTVVLGEPGSGKTVLLLRLMLDALAAKPPDSPVPILMRLATWDVSRQSFAEWQGSRLIDDYGCSREHSDLIVAERNLLLILDGLDEMPAKWRSAALREINQSLTRATSLVVASRTSEYLETMSEIDADVLTGAIVVEIQPLAPEVVHDYLVRATPPERAQRWDRLFEIDRTDYDGALADALCTPLAVSLARFAYADRDEDPQILLSLALSGEIGRHLLGQMLPNLYSENAFGSYVQISRKWNYRNASRWLAFLASNLRDRDTYDIAWWQLAYALPRWFRSLAGAFIGAVAGGLIGTFTGGSTGGPRGGISYGLVGALLGGLACWLTSGFGTWNGWLPEPSRVRIHLRVTGQAFFARLIHALQLGLTFGSAGGLILGLGVGGKFALEASVKVGFEDGILFGLVSGMLVGLVLGFVGEFTTMFGESAEVSGAVDPISLLRADRNRWALTGVTVGLVLAFALRLTGQLLAPIAKPLAVTNTGSIVVGLTVGLAGGLVLRAWGWLVLARVWLAVTRRMPTFVISFLADAHSREVLRQVGGVYQFSHALLRDRLADQNRLK